MKRLENLTDLQREILKTLQLGKENAKSLNEIRDYLSKEEVDANIPDLRDEMSKLIAYGAVRGFVEKGGRRYALSRGFGSGYRNQGSLL
jgi:predicted transcriptional regulator